MRNSKGKTNAPQEVPNLSSKAALKMNYQRGSSNKKTSDKYSEYYPQYQAQPDKEQTQKDIETIITIAEKSGYNAQELLNKYFTDFVQPARQAGIEPEFPRNLLPMAENQSSSKTNTQNLEKTTARIKDESLKTDKSFDKTTCNKDNQKSDSPLNQLSKQIGQTPSSNPNSYLDFNPTNNLIQNSPFREKRDYEENTEPKFSNKKFNTTEKLQSIINIKTLLDFDEIRIGKSLERDFQPATKEDFLKLKANSKQSTNKDQTQQKSSQVDETGNLSLSEYLNRLDYNAALANLSSSSINELLTSPREYPSANAGKINKFSKEQPQEPQSCKQPEEIRLPQTPQSNGEKPPATKDYGLNENNLENKIKQVLNKELYLFNLYNGFTNV